MAKRAIENIRSGIPSDKLIYRDERDAALINAWDIGIHPDSNIEIDEESRMIAHSGRLTNLGIFTPTPATYDTRRSVVNGTWELSSRNNVIEVQADNQFIYIRELVPERFVNFSFEVRESDQVVDRRIFHLSQVGRGSSVSVLLENFYILLLPRDSSDLSLVPSGFTSLGPRIGYNANDPLPATISGTQTIHLNILTA